VNAAGGYTGNLLDLKLGGASKLSVNQAGDTTIGGTLAVTGNSTLSGTVAFNKGTDYTTVGVSNNVVFGAGSLIRLTGASAQTITGIAGGTDGRILTLVNTTGFIATIANNSLSSAVQNRIITGTAADINLAPGASISLVYDSGSNLWRVQGSAASGTAGGDVFLAGTQTFTGNNTFTGSGNGTTVVGT
jgi:hypothetical protein